MIGVVVHPSERDIAAEFFELCKTPWQFLRDGARYDVLICTSEPPKAHPTSLALIFCGAETPEDGRRGSVVRVCGGGATLAHAGGRLPIYGKSATFPGSSTRLLVNAVTREPAAYATQEAGTTVVRVGYNLFEEALLLLTKGQPVENAAIPSLEHHIGILRSFITRAGLPFVEIPPTPSGYAFAACLTHDVDNPIMRNYGFDATTAGFAFRATFGSVKDFVRGRRTFRDLLRNWAAAAGWPLVRLGIAGDPWTRFDRFLEIEAGKRSTFFVIPFPNHPGRNPEGAVVDLRASRYTLTEIGPQLRRIRESGSEVTLHGLDAWQDAAAGGRERAEVSNQTGSDASGVRMHWLYFDAGSPAVLELAGFTYDSTVGYNQTTGYRAGTTQVYRPLGVRRLLELPMHVMDTALFRPNYLDLSPEDAFRRFSSLVGEFARLGGVLTINWHDRSIAPERLWEGFYRRMIERLDCERCWFPTAAQAVAWFEKRRNAAFEVVRTDERTLEVRCSAGSDAGLPGLVLRVHRPKAPSGGAPLADGPEAEIVDFEFNETNELRIAI